MYLVAKSLLRKRRVAVMTAGRGAVPYGYVILFCIADLSQAMMLPIQKPQHSNPAQSCASRSMLDPNQTSSTWGAEWRRMTDRAHTKYSPRLDLKPLIAFNLDTL
ncbi:hypothetical protein F4679DRAFT_461175 [Xylaria curta]|nr:hypothetical protein F4679DRAFT_461175 [Xylaria curta]